MSIIANVTPKEDILKERRSRIFNVKNFLLLFVSIFLVYFLLRHTEITSIQHVIDIFSKIQPVYIIISILLYFLSNYLKALRFFILLENFGINKELLFGIVSYQNFFNLILPARTGELTLIYYLKKLANINISRGFYSLLFTRIVDLVVVAVIFIVSSFIKWHLSGSNILLIIALIVLLFSVFFMFKLDSIIILIKKVFVFFSKFTKKVNKPYIQKIILSIDNFLTELIKLQQGQKYLKILFISIVIWLNLYLIFYYNIHAFIDGIAFNDVLIGATGAILTNVLPINSFGSFGTLETGWTGGFLLIGMSLSDAIITGFGSHIIMLLSAVIIVIVWKIYYFFKNKYNLNKLDSITKCN